jgi:hypothetical protein
MHENHKIVYIAPSLLAAINSVPPGTAKFIGAQ